MRVKKGPVSKAATKKFLINSAKISSMPLVSLYNFIQRHEKKKKGFLDEIKLPSGSDKLQWKSQFN